MAKIRADLDGIVCAFRETGEVIQLKAGDEIPAGIHLGSHLVESVPAEPQQETVLAPEGPESAAPKRRGRPTKGAADGVGD